MRFQDIPASILSFRVKSTNLGSEQFKKTAVLSVSPIRNRPDEFEVRTKESVFFVKPASVSECRRLGNELANGYAMLAQFDNPAADGSIELQLAIFSGECLEMGDIDIGVDEYLEERATEYWGKLEGSKLYKQMENRCCLIHGGAQYFFLTAGPAIDSVLKSTLDTGIDGSEENDSAVTDEADPKLDGSSSENEPATKNSFCVTGDSIRFVASEISLPDGKNIFITKRLTRSKGESDRAIRLAKGKLRFVDWTNAGQIQILAKAQLSALIETAGSYLRKWDEFGDLEGELLLNHAREVGAIQYCDMRSDRDGTVSVHIAEASDSALNNLAQCRVEEVQVVNEIPEYLRNPAMKFAEFVEIIEAQNEQRKEPRKREDSQVGQCSYMRVLDFDKVSKRLKLQAESLPCSGTLILSLGGEISQILRRMKARRAILEGRSVNPQLGLLIEENGKIASTRLPHKTKPLSALVSSKIFPENPPTVMQEEAIEVALNSPDILLIQGPPGTGKTTVIAAILERLNELTDKDGSSIKGRVLLTGFQHSAVENMIDRLWINGIPVPKFGRRSGASESDYSLFERKLEEWCSRISVDLSSRIPEIAELKQENEIRNLCLQYCRFPSKSLASKLVKLIAGLGSAVLGVETSRYAEALQEKLSIEELLKTHSGPLLESARSLRHRPDSFADDGPDRAADAITDLQELLNEKELDLLERASLWADRDEAPPFLKDLAELKKNLMIRFTSPPFFRVEKQNDEVFSLAETAMKRIRTAGLSASDKKSAALVEFLEELEGNPYGMIDAVSDYSFAFAATCQQSVNNQMRHQKGIRGKDSEQRMEYDYVIIDEAARVSPRDLMIPMALGKRIILVGDHRQLPHLIDEEVSRQIENCEQWGNESDWLKKSMFQYLFSERLKELEKKDGLTRRITLDKQFRMHPLLGEFISRSFYERFDSTEKFSSGLPEDSFSHNLPDTDGKPAVWLNVPSESGSLNRVGSSWTRPAEATAIARQLRTWVKSKEGRLLSYGVITYYKAQSELIKNQLSGLVDENIKLQIGTVDSFQGMEFDVVFLSMVRARTLNSKKRFKDRKRQAAYHFGHLCLSNRLNVSMSRQKKLLVVVGDCGLLQGDLAAEFIPGLVDFYELCRIKGKVMKCQ